MHIEYNDITSRFKYIVETERRFYLANRVDMQVRNESSDVYFEITLDDAWVWDINRDDRFIKHAHICTFKDVNIEELPAHAS